MVMCPKSCLLHTCHNSFVKGLKEFGLESEELANDIYYFFRRSPTRRQDLIDIQQHLGLDEKMAMRHLPSRWLTLVPALERTIEMKASLVAVLKDLVKTDKNLENDSKVQVILKSLQSRRLEAQMEFLVSVKPLFDEFLTRFQKEEPMIHKLYPGCEKLLKVAMSRMLKSEVYQSVEGRNLLHIDLDDVSLYLEREGFCEGSRHKSTTSTGETHRCTKEVHPRDAIFLYSCHQGATEKTATRFRLVVCTDMPGSQEPEEFRIHCYIAKLWHKHCHASQKRMTAELEMSG